MVDKKAPKRKTSRDIQADERRQQILAVAKKMFAEGGYHATSMRSLNKELGVADALTYHYFPEGKLEILQTIIREGRDAKIAEIEALVPRLKDDLPLKEALSLAAQLGSQLFSGDKDLLQILMRERNWLRQEEWLRTLGTEEPPTAFLMDYFAKRMAQGEIRTMDLPFAFGQFFAGIIMHSLFEDEAGSTDSGNDLYLKKLVDFTAQLWSA